MRFSVLGPLEVTSPEGAIEVGGPRQRAVLAALLLRANEVASVPYLTESVWEKTPAAPESNLRTYICRLRHRLARPGGAPRITTRDGGYVLLAPASEVDTCLFTELASEGDAALGAGDCAAAANRYSRALALWRGRPLEGLGGGTRLRAELGHLEDRRVQVAENYARAACITKGYHEVTSVLRKLVTDYPLREELWSGLMSVLTMSGRRSEALQAYREARGRLVAELGLEPGRQLQLVHQQALAEETCGVPGTGL